MLNLTKIYLKIKVLEVALPNWSKTLNFAQSFLFDREFQSLNCKAVSIAFLKYRSFPLLKMKLDFLEQPGDDIFIIGFAHFYWSYSSGCQKCLSISTILLLTTFIPSFSSLSCISVGCAK